jgi:Single Cache domain 2
MEAEMKNRIAAAVLCTTLALPALGAPGEEQGTRKEAEFMLTRAVGVLKVDEKRALDLFTSGHGGFLHKDLYVYCMSADGMLTAHPYFMGANLGVWKDNTGKEVGKEILSVAREGKFSEVSYTAPRPKGGKVGVVDAAAAKQVEKVAFVTKVGEQICGVGYYK